MKAPKKKQRSKDPKLKATQTSKAASELVLLEADLPRPGAELIELAGAKAAGLRAVPATWRLPIAVVPIHVFAAWAASNTRAERESVLLAAAGAICSVGKIWEATWPNGLILRSSAQDESLADRGRFETKALPADFDARTVAECVGEIFASFAELSTRTKIAILLQPYLATTEFGHITNERRVSPTENRWVYEPLTSGVEKWNFNSWRNEPDPAKPLQFQNKQSRKSRIRETARWLTKLRRGRCVAEVAITSNRLLILQIDFEDESPDHGVDPSALLRPPDARPPGKVPKGSPITAVDLDTGATGWTKIDNALLFKQVRGEEKYPQLFALTGDSLTKAIAAGRDVAADIAAITHDRAVIRTACQSKKVAALNQPRTDCTDGRGALSFMQRVLADWGEKQVDPTEICFVLHKFIPAAACAWASASPNERSVLIDGLWGVPDGLQYYAHDTFEYDVTLDEVVARKLRYKPAFIQEQADGSWQLIRVARPFTRRTSLSTKSICEVGRITQAIADAKQAPIMVMWFCEISAEAGIGSNLPWFSMPAPEEIQGSHARATPGVRRIAVSNLGDIDRISASDEQGGILEVRPEVKFVRETPFLEAVIELAKKGEFSVELSGSVRGHAFHQIHAAGIPVFHSDPITHTRIRKKQSFGKLVRDEIPKNIERRGESARLARIAKSESRRALLGKLQEEMFELSEARSPEQVAGELADVLEVVRSLALATGIDWASVESGAAEKKAERGSFERNVVLLETGVLPPGRSVSNPETIGLADLARLSRTSEAVLPFAALYANGADTTVTLPDGRMIALSLERSGIRVSPVESPLAPAGSQLELDFGP